MADPIETRAGGAFNPHRSGGLSRVRATFSVSVIETLGRGQPIPEFKGGVEARGQGEVPRIAGHARNGVGWMDERVKIALKDAVHARIQGARVDLSLRTGRGESPQRLALEMFTPDAAAERVEWLPAATPPEPTPAGPAARPCLARARGPWVAVLGITLMSGLLLLVQLLSRRSP